MTRDELAEAVGGGARLDAALTELVVQGRIARCGDRFTRNPDDHDFFAADDLDARVDGLNRQQDVLAEAVWQRQPTPAPPAGTVARTYVFAATDADMERLVGEVLAGLRRRCISADVAARDQDVHNRRAITLATATLEAP